jgi:urease accessory protein
MSSLLEQLRAGWQGELELRFQAAGSRTRLAHQRHIGPLLVQRPFYPESQAPGLATTAEPCHIYVIHPPGGVAGGDELRLAVTVEPRAHVLLTTPAAGKFYRSGGAQLAQLSQHLVVQDGVLEWLPQENIFYPDSVVRLATRVQLSGSARFIGWELGCLGLPARQQTLARGSVHQAFELSVEGVPLLLERLHLHAQMLEARWGLAGFVSHGSWLAYPATAGHLEQARALLEPLNCAELEIACTLLDGVLCCRAAARRADQLKQIFIQLWCALRPALLGRAATMPRIWAT